ncbi:MAG: hypothetical protein VW226_13605, partial [Rhodospirillaceae bacterium]
LNQYAGDRIEGSNPSPSANLNRASRSAFSSYQRSYMRRSALRSVKWLDFRESANEASVSCNSLVTGLETFGMAWVGV